MARALTIAGSDSGGGAGIQADLKTFAALGVHGMSAITAITAQNTTGVVAIQEVDAKIVRAQIEAVVEDIGVDAAKTGMLYSSKIIEAVAEEVEEHGFPVVVDPVMVAKSGAPLLKKEAVKALAEKLIPLAAVVTPNAMEAEALSGVKVESLEGAKESAKEIAKLGAAAVVVKGGHVNTGDKVYDVLYHDGKFKIYEGDRLPAKSTHGTGCVFSSAITAELAKGKTIEEAVKEARKFVADAIRFGLPLGRGVGPVDPTASLHNEAEKYNVLMAVKEAIKILEENPKVACLIPESQSNIGMALRRPSSASDVAAVPGRIVRLRDGVKASAHPEFGASRHVANTILTAMKHDPAVRSAMNIRYSKELVDLCKSLGMTVSFYDRKLEPPEIKKKEGMTTVWGTEEAIKKAGRVPDVIYHEGDYGKEPMIIILGRDAVEVARKVVKLSERAPLGLNARAA